MKALTAATGLLCLSTAAFCQVIEFESNGLKYQTLTKGGVTVMFAHMPSHVREFSVLQVAVSNGSDHYQTVKPEDFTFERHDEASLKAWSARDVVALLIEKGSRGDVIKLVSTYESALYGMTRMRSSNGYEARRQAALAEVASTKLKSAAAASAIVLVSTRLGPGQSTDGAVFFETAGKPLGPGRLIVRSGRELFEFQSE